MAIHTCWYCIKAFREDCSTVTCNRDYQARARSYSCPYWVECPRKKYAGDEDLKI